MGEIERETGGTALWPVPRFGFVMGGLVAAGLAAAAFLAPGRGDLLAAAAAGAGFGAAAAVGGYLLVARSAARSMQSGVQAFLAVMTAKVVAFAAFLLTLALTTSLDPVALAAGLVGATLAGEFLVVTSLRRLERAGAPAGGTVARDEGRAPGSEGDLRQGGA